MLSSFLGEGVAEAQTLRTHGLIARNITVGDVAMCGLGFRPFRGAGALRKGLEAYKTGRFQEHFGA